MHFSCAACWLLPWTSDIPSDLLDYASSKATEKQICYVCWWHSASAMVFGLFFFTPFLHEHCQSWTHRQHLAACLWHLQKHPEVRKLAIFLSGAGWDTCVGFLQPIFLPLQKSLTCWVIAKYWHCFCATHTSSGIGKLIFALGEETDLCKGSLFLVYF